jgi:ArsR family transcriptional regulator, lead/cadmium/zinc/bismuth-responsive transcriptional repressor
MAGTRRGYCSPKPDLRHRPLLTDVQIGGLRELFKSLANDTRLRILHALVRSEELCVTELAEMVGMKPQAVSNQLRRLSGAGILGFRREGNNILYRIADPCAATLLDTCLCLLEDAKIVERRRRSTA